MPWPLNNPPQPQQTGMDLLIGTDGVPSFTTTNINVDEYIEGTIFIDMIDKENSRLVWQGRGIGTINEHVNAEKREKRIKKSIAKIFNKYPPMKE